MGRFRSTDGVTLIHCAQESDSQCARFKSAFLPPSASVVTRIVDSGQRPQFTSREWQLFLRQHSLEASMSRRENGHGNVVAESFF